MVIFGTHTFVKYANNLYTPKILSLKITTTHYFGNMHISLKITHKPSRVHNRVLSTNTGKHIQFTHIFVLKSHENGMRHMPQTLSITSETT